VSLLVVNVTNLSSSCTALMMHASYVSSMSVFLLFSFVAFAVSQGLPVRSIYQFPQYTFLENLRMRQNGTILLTRLDVPHLLSIDPTSGQGPQLVHDFSPYGAVGGITETEPELFIAVTGNFSIFKLDPAPGTYSVYTVDYRVGSCNKKTGAPRISKLTDVPEAAFLDGITYQPSAQAVWLADAEQGLIYKMNLHSGKYTVAINNTLTQKCHPNDFEAVNGLKYFNSHLYWTNSGCGWYAKIAVDARGNIVGEASIVSNPTLSLDDFDIRFDGTSYHTASYINQIAKISAGGIYEGSVAGSLNSSAVAQPTALMFGRMPRDLEHGTMYVVTGGALGAPINGTTIVGAQLLSIDTM